MPALPALEMRAAGLRQVSRRTGATSKWRRREPRGSLGSDKEPGDWLIPSLRPSMLSRSRVIAKGRRIRDAQRLVAAYGGRVARWVKKSSPRLEDDEGKYEIHWYEHPGIGRVELKRKQVAER